jgi:hypothetical protein
MREKPTNTPIIYSFSLLIKYGSSYMFRHYIAIFRERFWYLLRDAQEGGKVVSPTQQPPLVPTN